MLEKTMRMSDLYDFYGALLTPKQQSYMSLYYLDDYSLGEIAEQFSVSRQAVYDTLKRTETLLEDFEAKLSLYSKFRKRERLFAELRRLVGQTDVAPEKILKVIDSLEQLD